MSDPLLQSPGTSSSRDVEIDIPSPSTDDPVPARGEQGSMSCLENLLRCILSCILLVVGVALGVIGLVLCSPCIVVGIARLCILRYQLGPIVTLNGLQASELDEGARHNIEQAQASPYHVQLGNVLPRMSQVGRTLSRRLSGAVLNDSFTATGEAIGEGVSEKRDALMIARRERDSERTPGLLHLQVERDHIVEQTLKCLGSVPSTDLLARRLVVEFAHEYGADAGGLRRDWFDSLGRELVSAADKGDGLLMVLPDKTVTPRAHEQRFADLYALGRLAGLAIWFATPLPLPLGSVICKFILDAPIALADLNRLDPDFYQYRIKPIMKPGGVPLMEEALCEPLMFMSAATDQCEPQELCPGGAERQVTEENKREYLKLLCEHYLCGDMREQINVFLQGFWDIFPKDDLKATGMTYRELSLMIAGSSTLDPEDWRNSTVVAGGPVTEAEVLYQFVDDWRMQIIDWFWQMVNQMGNEERAKLLHFATGSSRVPSGGFAGLDPLFNISFDTDGDEHLPQAHTCGNNLVIPKYGSYETLVEKFKIAMANDDGFGEL